MAILGITAIRRKRKTKQANVGPEVDDRAVQLRTPEGGAPGTAHEGRGESRELNEVITNWKRVPQMRLVRRVNETN